MKFMEIGEFQSLQKFAPERSNQFLQLPRARGLQTAGPARPDLENIYPGALECELHGLPIGYDALLSGFVDQSAQFAEAPTERAPWIVGDIPEQRAEALASLRPPTHDKIGQQRAGLFRRGKLETLAPAHEFRIP
jgi:hypothetical protein